MWKEFLAWLIGIGHDTLTFLMAAGKAIAAAGGPILVQAATQAVLAAEAQGGDNDAKKAAAIAATIKVLTDQGIPAALNAVNLAVETAVANMKAASVATDAPVPPGTPAAEVAAQAQAVPEEKTIDHPGDGGEQVPT